MSKQEIAKPLTAHQLYLKAWHTLSDKEKNEFEKKAEKEKLVYEEKLRELAREEEDKVRELGIYLSYSYGRVPCVGLDNGFYSREVIGPAHSVEEYNVDEQELYGIKYKKITIGKFTWQHNKGYWKKNSWSGSDRNIYTLGRGWKSDRITKARISNEKNQFHKTYYINYKDEHWEETIEKSMLAA